jgi:hypothetical protein
MVTGRVNLKYLEETCPSCYFAHHKFTWTAVGFNTETSAVISNRLNSVGYGTALTSCVLYEFEMYRTNINKSSQEFFIYFVVILTDLFISL